MPTKLILDVDTGTDDAVALMFAALHPDLELVAATTVNGNVLVDRCTENTLRVFDVIGANIPVYEGAGRPMLRPDFPVPAKASRASGIHGEYLDLPPARSEKQRERAVDFLIDTYMSAAGTDIVLVPVGPLTNIALAMAVEPRIVERIPRMIIMGGGHEVGNVTPAAEFNIWADPEAARVVLTSGVRNLTLVPLDATHKALITLDDCQRLRELGTPAGDAAATVVERRIAGYGATQPMKLPDSAPVHDALCVAAIVDPSVITTSPFHVDVETTGELTVGRTVIDTHRRRGMAPNADVALDADGEKFVRLMMETFARKPLGSAVSVPVRAVGQDGREYVTRYDSILVFELGEAYVLRFNCATGCTGFDVRLSASDSAKASAFASSSCGRDVIECDRIGRDLGDNRSRPG